MCLHTLIVSSLSFTEFLESYNFTVHTVMCAEEDKLEEDASAIVAMWVTSSHSGKCHSSGFSVSKKKFYFSHYLYDVCLSGIYFFRLLTCKREPCCH